MEYGFLSLEIETLVLVAVWEKPFVFQGRFSITHQKTNTKVFLLFRCECYLESKSDIHDSFFPDDYHFTHLYTDRSEIYLNEIDDQLEHALYLLKYALNTTLQKMIIDTKQLFTYVDEVAMSSIIKQIENYTSVSAAYKIDDANIGFAVSINFTPSESIGKMAASALLGIHLYCEFNNKKLIIH